MTHAVCLAGPVGITLQQLREVFDLLNTGGSNAALSSSGPGAVVATTEPRPDRTGDLQPQVVLRYR
jgi:hypothetical protein